MTILALTALTSSTLDGSGVFDTLMRANKAHLQAEFDKGRIRGPEYATVYLGSLQAVMQTAMEFLVQRQKVLLEATLLEKQIAQVQAQTDLANQQKANLILEALNIPKQGAVLDAQKCKLQAEFDLTVSSTLRSATEITLLTQKTATEKANTTALGVDADSVVGRQKSLYHAQAEGFKRAAEQKAAEVLVDTWKVARTTDETTQANADNKLSDVYIGRVVGKLLEGVAA